MRKQERGFSLIEILIVVLVLGFILLGVVGFGSKIRSGIATYGQVSERHDREEIFTNQTKRDFENVGLNLFLPLKRATSGQVDALFFPNSDFSVSSQSSSPVNITRTAPGIANPLVSGWALIEGSGEMSFSPNVQNAYFTFYKPAGGSYSFYLSGATGAWSIFSGGSQVFAAPTANDAVLPGDRVTLALDAAIPTGSACSMSYYRNRASERRLLYRQNVSCSDYPFQFSIALDGGSRAVDYSLRGTLFKQIGGETRSPTPPLPLFNGTSAAAPVWIDPNGESFTLLGSDPDADASLLTQPAVFVNPQQQMQLQISNRLRGAINAGDYFLLVDGENRKSVLGQVRPNSGATAAPGSEAVFFQPATPSGAAWNDFWSSPADYLGHQFTTRARLVKLLAPVTYKSVVDQSDLSNSQGNRVIVRRSGTSPWEKIAFGVTEFKFSDASVNNLHIYNMKFSTVPEDSDSVDPHPVSLSFSPTALNQ